MLDQLKQHLMRLPDTQFINDSKNYTRERILQEQARVSGIDQFTPRGATEWTIILMVIIFSMMFWYERKKIYK